MAIEVIWTPEREKEFIERAGLIDDMAMIISIRHCRHGRVKDLRILADNGFPMSPEAYDARVRTLKALYDAVQPGSLTLPPRQKSKRDALKFAAFRRNAENAAKTQQ